jgi:hypothetical protein
LSFATASCKTVSDLDKRFVLTELDPIHHNCQPEVILGSLDEFETCPNWVPAIDTGQLVVRITAKTMGVHGFDHRANWVAKVRNVSSLGSQITFSGMSAI